jgi:hypothetical protein
MSNFIIVGFSTPKKTKIVPTIIKLVEHTSFSHVYIKIWSNTLKRYLVYQASGTTVNFCSTEIFDLKNKIIAEYKIEITEEQKINILQKCVDSVGKPYGVGSLVGLGLVRFCAMFGKKINNPFADGSKTYICSEIAATLLLSLGFSFDHLDNLTPKDIYNKLRGMYGEAQ